MKAQFGTRASGMVNTSRTHWIMFEMQSVQFVSKHHSGIQSTTKTVNSNWN